MNQLATKTACSAWLLALVVTGCGIEQSAAEGEVEAPLFGTLWHLRRIERANLLRPEIAPAVEAEVEPEQTPATFQLFAVIDAEYLAEIKSDCGTCYGKVRLEDDIVISMEMACSDGECQSQGISKKYLEYLKLMHKRYRQGQTLQIHTAMGFEGYWHILHFSSRPSSAD